MKICCSGAISPSNVLAFRALAKLLSESTLISQVRPELVVNAMELGVRMTARCLSEPSASGSARDWRLLQSALELVIASPRPLELKHLNDVRALPCWRRSRYDTTTRMLTLQLGLSRFCLR
jgi:hypothetical protein